MSRVELTPCGERVLRALAGACIDPGELTFDELLTRTRPTSSQGLERTLARLHADELVEVLHGGSYIQVTEKGRAICIERRYPTAVRT